MDINQLAAGTQPAEGGGLLPPGEYAGMTGTPVQKTHEGKVFYEIPVSTKSGNTNTSIWEFDQNDYHAVAADPSGQSEHVQKIQKKIARAKRLYVDLGVWSQDQAQSASWNQGAHSVIGSLAQLANRPCHVVVKARDDDPKKTITFINAPRSDAQNMGLPPGVTTYPLRQDGTEVPPNAGPVGGYQPPQNTAPMPSSPPETPDLDGIPF